MAEILDYADGGEGNQATPPDGLPRNTIGGLVYDVIREIMARLKRNALDAGGAATATGTNGNYAVATSSAMTLRPGAVVMWRSNHANPNASPTLNAGGTGSRPLSYADGTSIPALAIGARQLILSAWDNANGRWNATIMPASQFVGSVTGDKISLSGQAVGSVAIYTSGGWIASAAGAVGQYFQGGSNPGFATPSGIPGMAILACSFGNSLVATNKSGLPYTAIASKVSTGKYRLVVSPAMPSFRIPMVTFEGSVQRMVTIRATTTTTIDIGVSSTVYVAGGASSLSSGQVTGDGPELDLGSGQLLHVTVF